MTITSIQLQNDIFDHLKFALAKNTKNTVRHVKPETSMFLYLETLDNQCSYSKLTFLTIKILPFRYLTIPSQKYFTT